MKALRGLKKPKIVQFEDPEKLAEQKLAILSDEAFIFAAEESINNTEPWTIQSSNAIPSFLAHDLVQSRQEKRQKPFSSFHSKNKPSISEQLSTQNQLKKYIQLYGEEQLKAKKTQEVFPQRKSLSLTNYILFDKRKKSGINSPQKGITPKFQFQRLKVLHLKKLLASRKHKRSHNSLGKTGIIQSSNQTQPAKINFSTQHNSPEKVNDFQNSSQVLKTKNRLEESRKKLQAQNVLQSIFKKKDVPINMKKYSKQYFLMKQKTEKVKQVQSSIASTKIKLQQYYKKFTY